MLCKFHKVLNDVYYTKLKSIIENSENPTNENQENIFLFVFKHIYTRFAQILIITLTMLSRLLSPILSLLDNIIYLLYKIHIYIKYRSIKTLNYNKSKMQIILDLDDTLMYESSRQIPNLRQFQLLNDGSYIYIRPYTRNFLSSLDEICDFFIYTSATEEYANQIINYIDNRNCYFKKKLFGQDCVNSNGKFLKDVKKMKIEKRDKDKLLIIDDNPNCYLNYEDHIIQISYWEGDSSDDSLYKIQNILFSNYNGGGYFYNVILDSRINEI